MNSFPEPTVVDDAPPAIEPTVSDEAPPPATEISDEAPPLPPPDDDDPQTRANRRAIAEAEAEARVQESVGHLFGFSAADLEPPPAHTASPARAVVPPPVVPVVDGELVMTEERAMVLAGPLLERKRQVDAIFEDYRCESEADYVRAADVLDAGVQHNAHVADVLGPIKDWFYRRWQALNTLIKEREISKEQLDGVKRKASAFRTAQERKAREEAARLAEEQRRIEQARAEAEAKALENAGDGHTAALVREEARTAPPPVVHVPAATPKVSSLVGRKEWDFEIVNEAQIPDQYWVLDKPAIAAQVKRQKDACRIPGIRVFEREATTFRSSARRR